MICRVRQYSAFRQRLFCENTRAPQGAIRILTPTPSWRAYGWGEWGSYPQMLLRRRDRILISSAGASRRSLRDSRCLAVCNRRTPRTSSNSAFRWDRQLLRG